MRALALLLLAACGDADDAPATVPAHDHGEATGDWAEANHTHPSTDGTDGSDGADGADGSGGTPDRYTDAEAVAAVQNDDPWADPTRANLLNLWHDHERGWHWLDAARWTMDNRTDPPAVGDRHELVQMFHETTACDDTMAFADCNSTAALKMYINGPRIDTNDWSPEGYLAAAVRQQHTHSSGIYLVSFGRTFTPTDVGYGVIPGSGIHLEPHGAHQALRVDGTGNAGQNVRVDVMAGGTGLAIYGADTPATTCDALGLACDQTRLATLRGGVVRLEDTTLEQSATDARDAGVVTVAGTRLGVEHFSSWHTDSALGVPVHCAWNDAVTDDSLVKLTAYGTSPDLVVAHSYVLMEVWGPGNAPADCTGTQNIKTDAAGVYGYAFAASVMATGGFRVALLGPDPDAPLWPGDWGETQRPSFLYEVVEPL